MDDWLKIYPPGSAPAKACVYAREAHKNSRRENGDPYFNHSLAVAELAHQWGLDANAVAAALLHDVVEDENHSLADIKKEFGEEIAFLVDGLTKLDDLPSPRNQAEIEAENFRKLVISFCKDLRVLLIKLADRYHNMKTLQALPLERQQRFAWETMEIYAPLAYRLGMQKLSGELEDLAFPYVYPKEYEWLTDNVKEEYEERAAYAERVKPVIRQKLKEGGIIPLAIDSRAKSYYSLYRKLIRHDKDFDKIYDLVAIRIIVKTVEECYAVLGIIHQLWPPLPGRIKDYIARPKLNGYRSLHTTVFCLERKIAEIQIRTEEMHQEDELGIAAHWVYKQKAAPDKINLRWVEQLREWQKHFSGSEEYLQALKTDFFKERIFVLTPKNEVIDLPVGATPVDFAYRIHSEIGDQCVGAKVNGRMVPLNCQLASGDFVEILNQKGKKPSEDWLEFVKTALAREHIRSALRAKDKKLRRKADLKNPDR